MKMINESGANHLGGRLQVAGTFQPIPIVNFEPGTLYGDDNRYFGICSSIAKTSGGRLWCGFSSGGISEGHFNYGVVVVSDDDGHSWSAPRIVFDTDGIGPIRSDHVVTWVTPQGELWIMWNQYPEGLRGPNSSLWVISSSNPDDQSPAWTDPRKLADEQNLLNKPSVLADGTWIFPTGTWERHKPSRPLISIDQGKSFFPGGAFTADEPNCYDEYMIVERSNGQLVAFNRHARSFLECISDDKGRTWSRQKPNGIIHTNARFVFTKLCSGNWLLVKHGTLQEVSCYKSNYESTIGRTHLTAYLSRDEGRTWIGGLELDKRPISYPDGFQAEDGRIYITYERNRFENPEIILAIFTEEDIAAGCIVSPGARLKILVNKATGDKDAFLANPANEKYWKDKK